MNTGLPAHSATSAVTFHWRVTTDAVRVHAIHVAAAAKAPHGLIRPDALAHFERHSAQAGQILGCFLGSGEMVAYGVLALRSDNVAHLAAMLGAQEQDFCVLDGAAALPQWRGFGLHVAGIDARIRHAAALGLARCGATVSPYNTRSVRGLLHAGLEVRGFALMYGGLERLIVQHDGTAARPGRSRACSVALGDAAGHQGALAAGLAGYACTQDAAGAWAIEYGI